MEQNKNLRISTMTLVSGISSNIHLQKLYDNINHNDLFRYIEFSLNPVKGERKTKIKNPRKKKEKKFFYNQMTIHVFKDKIVNMKVFNNGTIQMTGLKSKQQGLDIVHLFIDELKKIPSIHRESILDNIDPEIKESRIVLINSDFDIHSKINRELLHRIIVDKGYYSSFEPTIYPGVNIKYYYNELEGNNGICQCSDMCNGKGNNCCKSITIAVFSSGKIIITGGQSYKHLNIAYDFISSIIIKNKKDLFIK